MVSAVPWLSCLVSCLFSCVGLGWHVVLCLVLCLVLSWSYVLSSSTKCQVEVADISVSHGIGGATIKNSLSFDYAVSLKGCQTSWVLLVYASSAGRSKTRAKQTTDHAILPLLLG